MPWADDDTARSYDVFARTFPMYAETSRDLVRLAELRPGMAVVDLGCGTGVTTEHVLSAVGSGGRVWGIDSSPQMLSRARERIRDANVTLIVHPAETFHLVVGEPADAVVCNSAFWQMDAGQTLAAAGKVLKEDGRLAFNLGAPFFRFSDEAANRPDVFALNRTMVEIAGRDYGYTPPARELRGLGALDLDGWERLLAESSFEMVSSDIIEYEERAEAIYEWLRIPVFATRLQPGLPYKNKMEVLEKAFWQVAEPDAAYSNRWIHIVTRPIGAT